MSFLGSIIRAHCQSHVSANGAFTDPGGRLLTEATTRGGLSPTEDKQAETTGWKKLLINWCCEQQNVDAKI